MNTTKCLQCGAKTEVLETCGNARKRRCLNPRCLFVFYIREDPITKLEYRRIRAITFRSGSIQEKEVPVLRNLSLAS
jgi:hypothetical protein